LRVEASLVGGDGSRQASNSIDQGLRLGRVPKAAQPPDHTFKIASPFVALGLAEIDPVVVRREDGSRSAVAVVARLLPCIGELTFGEKKGMERVCWNSVFLAGSLPPRASVAKTTAPATSVHIGRPPVVRFGKATIALPS
jgi:hypothetical protein